MSGPEKEEIKKIVSELKAAIEDSKKTFQEADKLFLA
jgi:hypothetical protein|tara:strand:+ start:429 stop:539 length:111 start_codon:yes stop_codon:yes gene_type:complete